MVAGVEAKHFVFLGVAIQNLLSAAGGSQNLLTEKISSAVGGSTSQDVAMSPLYLLDGLHQSHSFT